MKKIFILLIALITIHLFTFSQGCLPEGMIFGSQQQIDDFQTDYPGCTMIEGDVTIWGSGITNLEGLNVLTAFGGSLQIGLYYLNGTSLINLSGLENVTNISGDLIITENTELTSVNGIENIEYIGGNLTIHFNPILSNCNVESICNYLSVPNGFLTIENNAPGCNSIEEVEDACEALSSCLPEGITFTTQEQIDNFQYNYPGCTEIEGEVTIDGDYTINNLLGLNVLTSVGGSLRIGTCHTLSSLEGLENINYIGGDLYIYSNSLSDITALYNLTTIDSSLQIINNDDMYSLNGLDNLTYIGKHIYLYSNNILNSLESLSNITSINGSLSIVWDNNLESLTGLENISSIGNDLVINGSSTLVDITQLENLTSIGGNINFSNNNNLVSLLGIHNIEPNTIIDLKITHNYLLSTCEVTSICEYLANPNGTVEIFYNAPGCNSPEELEELCFVNTDELAEETNVIQIFPNPAKDEISILCPENIQIKIVCIFNQTGKKLLCKKGSNKTINISSLQAGLYFVEITTELGNIRQKLIID